MPISKEKIQATVEPWTKYFKQDYCDGYYVIGCLGWIIMGLGMCLFYIFMLDWGWGAVTGATATATLGGLVFFVIVCICVDAFTNRKK